MTASEARKALKKSVKQFDALPKDVPAAGYRDITLLANRVTTFNGLPCLKVDMTFTNARGKRQHDQLYMMMNKDMYYAIQLSAPEKSWEQNRSTVEGIANSFSAWQVSFVGDWGYE